MNGIYEYLIDNEINKNNLELLTNEFNKNDFIAFIGAGCSTPLGEPDWGDLFKQLRKKYQVKTRLTKNSYFYDFPNSFSRLHKTVQNGNNFFKDIFDILQPKITGGTFLHLRIVDAFDSYVTTNYDSPIEIAFFNQEKNEIKKNYFFCPYPEKNLNRSITYLHGHKDINFIIIKKEDYDYFYPTVSSKNGIPVLESFLEYLYTKKVIVFLGFSFSDLYLTTFLEHLVKSEDISKKKHFLLMSNNSYWYRKNAKIVDEYKKVGQILEIQKRENEFYTSFRDRFNIYPIVYTQHIFLERLLGLLSKKGAQIELKEYPISGEPVA